MTTVPRTPGRDFAGVVVEGPANVIGKKVWGTGGLNGFNQDGSFAEWIIIPSNAIAEMPDNLSFSQAAACGVGFLTAKLMLDVVAPKEGEYVLVLGMYVPA
jgi:NADPH:quinone reductase-like Zn-dependent oxidoreductase